MSKRLQNKKKIDSVVRQDSFVQDSRKDRMDRHSKASISNISPNYPSNVEEGIFIKDLDLSVIEGEPRYTEWKADIHRMLDNQFPQQSYEPDKMYQQRKAQYQNGKKYKCIPHASREFSVRLNVKYRLVFTWINPTSTTSTAWTRNELDGKYLKAVVKPSDRQNK